jgi:hypothetical protein
VLLRVYTCTLHHNKEGVRQDGVGVGIGVMWKVYVFAIVFGYTKTVLLSVHITKEDDGCIYVE